MFTRQRTAKKFRDLSLYPLGRGRCLVAACDAAGAIGPKPDDLEPATAESVGYFCTRVTFMELLTVGATPCVISCTFSVEREPTGNLLLSGVVRLLREEALERRLALLVSSENNFPTKQTALGVTMIGFARSRAIPWSRTCRRDHLFQVGQSSLGREASMVDPRMVSLSTVRQLVGRRAVREVIPLGSGGVIGELRQLQSRGVRVAVTDDRDREELSRSAGPATSALIVTSPTLDLGALVHRLQPTVPVWRVGQVVDVPQGTDRR